MPQTMEERHLQLAQDYVDRLRRAGVRVTAEAGAVHGLVELLAAVEGEVAEAHNAATARAIQERDEAKELASRNFTEAMRFRAQRDAVLRVIADIQDALADPEMDACTKLAGIARAVKAVE